MLGLKQRPTFSIRLTVLSLFVIVTCLTAALALGLQYYFSQELARSAATDSFHSTAEKVGERIQDLDRQAANLVQMLGQFEQVQNPSAEFVSRKSLVPLAGVMEQNESLYAIYVGCANGDFFELINPESGEGVRQALGAAPHDRWIVITVTGQGWSRFRSIEYLGPDLKIRNIRSEKSVYDPRQRPWFLQALGKQGVVKTPPYMLANLKSPGVTYALELDNGAGVLGVDITLATLSEFLNSQRLLPGSEAFIFDDTGEVVAHSEPQEGRERLESAADMELDAAEKAFLEDNPVIRASNELDWPPFDFALSGKPKGYSIDLLDLVAAKAGFEVAYVNGFSWEELEELFRKGELDLLHSLVRSEKREEWGLFSKAYKAMPQAFITRKGGVSIRSLSELHGHTVAIPRGWATEQYLRVRHPEIGLMVVETPLDALQAVSSGVADAALDARPVLRYLLENYHFKDLEIGGGVPELQQESGNSLHFLVQKHQPELRSILDKALAALTPEEWARLDEKWFGGGSGLSAEQADTAATVPHDELLQLAAAGGTGRGIRLLPIKDQSYFVYVASLMSSYGAGEHIGFMAPVADTLGPYMERINFSIGVTLCLLLLLAPVVWRLATLIVRPINALAFESDKVRQRRYDAVAEVKSNIKEIKDLSRSMVTMASSIKAYEEAQRELMDSFIRLIAAAIDQKSPYTGGHCERVPQLAAMIAKEASDAQQGPFASFRFANDDQWREFHIAAWLHDCGKVTTPEYIVDKGTKLEAICNRIHEIRTRFEVLWRDAEIEYWQAMAQGREDPDALAKRLRQRHEQIRDDFAFVAECNVGGEFMAQERVERIKIIAAQTWTRHLDDRLGCSHVELQRYPEKAPDSASDTAPALPCQEQLLADKPEHVIPRPPGRLTQNRASFSMQEPEHLYNQGEVYNLCISRGTLTAEDRYKINEHVITTIRMLETLPYPENLSRIPEYAGAHHETLAGTGYPRGLAEEELSIPARILAIADIFEALTASDRPYKKAKKLSEAVKILSFMAKDRHIDAELFRLFLASGVYLEYARKFLAPEQLDEVDVQAYLQEEQPPGAN